MGTSQAKPSAAQTPKGRDRGCTRAQTKETTQETYLKTKMKASLLTKTRFSGARLAIKAASRRSASVRMGARAEVGLFYSTSTGNTEAAADWIKQKFSGDITDPTDIGEVDVSDLEGYSSLIVGAPTWNTGADEGRSGTPGTRSSMRSRTSTSAARRLPSSAAETPLPTE